MSLHVDAVDAGAAYECVCVRHAGARLNDEHHQIFMHNACAIGSTSLMRVLFRWLSNRNTHRIYLVCLSVGRFRPSVCHTGATTQTRTESDATAVRLLAEERAHDQLR